LIDYRDTLARNVHVEAGISSVAAARLIAIITSRSSAEIWLICSPKQRRVGRRHRHEVLQQLARSATHSASKQQQQRKKRRRRRLRQPLLSRHHELRSLARCRRISDRRRRPCPCAVVTLCGSRCRTEVFPSAVPPSPTHGLTRVYIYARLM